MNEVVEYSEEQNHQNLIKLKFTNLVLLLFYLLFFGSALGAYNIGPIPIQWLTQVGLIALLLIVALRGKINYVPGSVLYIFLILWAVAVTVIKGIFGYYPSMMPSSASTPYMVFIVLRFLSLLSFIATVYLVYWLFKKGYRDAVIKWLVTIGTIIAVLGLYIYIAQIYGLPELARNRMGTGGGEQSVVFTYAFHRAMGTFREPSHLAEWLVVPLFLSFIRKQRLFSIHSMLMGATILLTGSLTGILGLSLGFMFAVLLANPVKKDNLKKVLQIAILAAVAFAAFYALVASKNSDGVSLFQVIGDRVGVILTKGISESNRGYVFEYVAGSGISMTGEGFGNSNILFSKYIKNPVITSFLSLYFNFLLSTGVIGLTILIIFLLRPVMAALFFKFNRKNMIWVLAPYISWLIMFAIHSEEFSSLFAIAYALLSFDTANFQQAKGEK